MTHRSSILIVSLAWNILAVCAGVVSAQSPEVLVVGGVPRNDLKLAFGLVQDSSAAAAANRQKLQERIDAGPPIYPWFVPGGTANLKPFYVDSTVILKNGGREIDGTGAANGFGGSHLKYGSYLLMRAQHFATSFDGSTNTGSTLGLANVTFNGTSVTASTVNSTTIEITGHTVVESDRRRKLNITGGSGFLTGDRWVVDADKINNRWVLDRAVTSSSGSGMAGTAVESAVEIDGRTLVPQDKFNSFEITPRGTNFVPGWYTITHVDPDRNLWLLDRACTSGGAGSGMIGLYCPTLIQDHGVGSSIRGIGFLGRRVISGLGDALQATTAYHVATNTQTGAPSGKHHFENCFFDNFHTAILFGGGLAQLGESANSWYRSGGEFGNADESTFANIRFGSCNNCFAARNIQAVHFSFHHVKANDLRDTVFRFDAGGKLTVNSVEASGQAEGSRQRILHLGRGVSGPPSGHDPFILNGVSFDGGQNTRNPQLITTDWDDLSNPKSIRVQFNGVNINRADAHDNLPLIDIQSRCRVTVMNAVGGFWADSVRLRYGTDSGDKPVLLLIGCSLGVVDPAEIIDEANSDSGVPIVIRSCTNLNGDLLTDSVIETP